MDGPSELSLSEIRKFMLENGCKVTNHALVKHFKRFLTDPVTQAEARKHFKTYVNILATIKNENNQKYLILRKKYLSECPSEDSCSVEQSIGSSSSSSAASTPLSPGAISLNFESGDASSSMSSSPFRQPPPYKPPPEVSPVAMSKVPPVLEKETKVNYKDCINEFQAAMHKLDPGRVQSVTEQRPTEAPPPPPAAPSAPPRKRSSAERSLSRESSIDDNNKENIDVKSESAEDGIEKVKDPENSISVKEAARKFNRLASEEEAKVLSPSPKKKPDKEKPTPEEKVTAEVTLAHPKGKEWIVLSSKCSYQDLAKLASDYPELIKLQDPTTGYTALHWAAKHGNEDVVKLIAGTYKADVNSRTNGGYTPLHLAMQFGKENIFDLLVNVYKANRDLTDWSGNKPLDYSQQKTSVSASTYSSEYELLRPKTYQKLGLQSSNGNRQNRATFAAVSGNGVGLSLTRRKRESRKNPNNNNPTNTNQITTLDNTIRAQSMLLTGNVMSAQEKCEMFLANERGENSSDGGGGSGGGINENLLVNEAKNEQLLDNNRKSEKSGGSKRHESFLAKKRLKLKINNNAGGGKKTSNEDTYC